MNLKRLLVTPNTIGSISAHYAFYFSNQFPIKYNDNVGGNFSSENYTIDAFGQYICNLYYLPKGVKFYFSAKYNNFFY